MSTKSGAHLRAPSATQEQGKPPSTHGGAGTAAGSPELHIPGGQKVPKQREGKRKILLGVEGKRIPRNTYPSPKCAAEGSGSPRLSTRCPLLTGFPDTKRSKPRTGVGARLGTAKPGSAWLS